MKTIKIINLLNKIANGEEVPKFIKYHDRILIKSDIMLCCYNNLIYKLDNNVIDLNDTVEIIEENNNKIDEKETKNLLTVNLIFEYYKNNNILDRYYLKIDANRLIIDNNCLNILNKPNTRLYITPYNKTTEKDNNKINEIIDRINGDE